MIYTLSTMKQRFLHALILAAVILAPGTLSGAMRGDTGWSDNGTLYGFCDPEIMPDAPGGCLFFNRDTLEWFEVGRREALNIWQVWKPPHAPLHDKPLLPVYPLDENERNSGIVKLCGRMTATDDVIEIWRLKKSERPDEMGSRWETVFDYSPDGTWLAAGALRVNFSNSENLLHVIVRPVSHWLVITDMKAGLDKLSKGQLADGLSRLSSAGSRFEKLINNEDAIKPKPPGKKRPLKHFIDEDVFLQESWIEKTGILRWSGDGKKLCVCDAWEDAETGQRASCRYFEVASGAWISVVAEKINYVCLETQPPADEAVDKTKYPYWVDWGKKNGTINVVVYMVMHKSEKLAAVMQKEVKQKLKKNKMEGSTEPVFHAVALPSPAKKNIAVGFMKEASDHGSLHYFLEVDTAENWKKRANEDLKSKKKGKPKLIEKVQGIF